MAQRGRLRAAAALGLCAVALMAATFCALFASQPSGGCEPSTAFQQPVDDVLVEFDEGGYASFYFDGEHYVVHESNFGGDGNGQTENKG